MEYKRQIKSSVETARDMASVLFWTFRGILGLIVTYIGYVIISRPVYASMFLFVILLLLNYVLRADSMWHQSQHLENQFWMLISFLLSSNFMFAPDSPYLAASWTGSRPEIGRALGATIVIATVTTAHFLDKHHHRTRLRTLPSLIAFDELIQNSNADEIVTLLQGYVNNLDRTLPSTFHTMWNITEFVRNERSVLGVFSNCSRTELNYIIVRVEMKLITYKLKNHSKASDVLPAEKRNRCRSELLDILARRRVSDLNLASRAIVLDVIQGLRLSNHPDTAKEAQEWILNLLSTVRGDDLSELKQLVDNKGSAESMHKLVYNDVTDEAVREKILRHFKSQASIQAAQMAMGSSLARKRLQKGAWRKILSDVDDTLFSSGGRYPAGIDVSYKRKVFYPAVTALYRELNLGARGSLADAGLWPPKRSGDLVFLSARPHVYKDVTETSMYLKFRTFMKSQALHCMPSLLPGDLESGQAFMMQGLFLPMALKKLKNFEQYYSIYPEYTHIFIGDNGQADVKAAELMVNKFGNKVVERVYIHEVQPRSFTFGYEEGVSDLLWYKSGIVFCRTYVRAALDAAQHGLIRFGGLRRVAVAAHEDFQRIKNTWTDPYERDIRRLEMNADLMAANDALESAGFPSTGLIHGDCEFVKGSVVNTVFGRGYVASYKASTGVYEVILDWGTAGHPTSKARLYCQLHGLFRNKRALTDVQRRLFRPRARTTDHLSQLADTLTKERSSSTISRPEDLILPNENTIREAATATIHKIDKPAHLDPFSGFLTPAMFYPGKRAEPYSRKRLGTDVSTPRRPSVKETKSDAMLTSGGGRANRRRSFFLKSAPEQTSDSALTAPKPASVMTSNLAAQMDAIDLENNGSPPRSPSPSPASAAPSSTENSEPIPEKLNTAVVHPPRHYEADEVEDVLELGTRVKTPYGEAVVLVFRERDSIYELAIPSMNASAYVSEDSLIMWNTKLFEERARAMVRVGSYPHRLYGLMKKLFTREGGEYPNQPTPAKGKVAETPTKPKFEQGAIVKTPFGQGLVLKAREDGIIEVRLLWAAYAYLNENCVSLDEDASKQDAASLAKLLKLDQSPLQKARELFNKNWELLKMPFTSIQLPRNKQSQISLRNNESSNTPTLPNSDSLLSLCSLVTAASATSSNTYLSAVDEAYGIRPGDVVDTNGFGVGEVLSIRPDGFFVVRLPYATAYIHVPRLLLGNGNPHSGPEIPTGAHVVTPYGLGVVRKYRESDGVYEVAMSKWNAMAYIPSRPEMKPSISSASLRSEGVEAQASLQGSSRAEDGNTGSIKSSILSFITNIIHYPKPEDRSGSSVTGNGGDTDKDADEVRSSDAYGIQDDASWHHVMGLEDAVPPGHTVYSWFGDEETIATTYDYIKNAHVDIDPDDFGDRDEIASVHSHNEMDNAENGAEDATHVDQENNDSTDAKDESQIDHDMLEHTVTVEGTPPAEALDEMTPGEEHHDTLEDESTHVVNLSSIPPGHTLYSWTSVQPGDSTSAEHLAGALKKAKSSLESLPSSQFRI